MTGVQNAVAQTHSQGKHDSVSGGRIFHDLALCSIHPFLACFSLLLRADLPSKKCVRNWDFDGGFLRIAGHLVREFRCDRWARAVLQFA